MACDNIENLFIQWAQLIRNDVAKSILNTDFFIKNLDKEQWLDGQGRQYSYPVYERSLPETPVTFAAFSTLNTTPDQFNNLEPTGGCDNVGSTINSFGITLRQASLIKAALNSPLICLDDLRFEWQVMDQVNNITRVLAENSKWVWSVQYQNAYSAACGNLVIAAAGMPTDSVWLATAPTSKLTWGILDWIYEQLQYAGGDVNPYQRVDDMTPIYAAVGDRFVFEDLKRQDSNTRSDFHFAYEGAKTDSPYLQAPGLAGIFRGYRFFNIQFAPRWDFVTGAWVQRFPYDATDPTSYYNATRGKAWQVGQKYQDAAYTDTAIFHKDVMRILVPKPNSNKGQMAYNPAYSWAGEFAWRNIPDLKCNPDMNKGFFRALYAYGVKVERPDLGFMVRHLRCDPPSDLQACYEPTIYEHIVYT